MIVINSSPAINLSHALDDLRLLSEVFGKVTVPCEVMQELEFGADKDNVASQLRRCGFDIRRQPVSVSALLINQLDVGELAVIQTALQEGIQTVLLDDLKARRIATRVGLNVTGSLGVIVLCKQLGKIVSVRSACERMTDGGAWLDESLVARAIELSGE